MIAVALGAALAVATCSTRDNSAPPTSAPATSPLDALAEAGPLDSGAAPSASATASAAPSAAPRVRSPGHELDGFYAALRALKARSSARHVRVLWLGDSHGAADLWTSPLRDILQTRFGNAGPGFGHIGYRMSRNASLKVDSAGKWTVYPRAPATSVVTGDGIFGLGGVLVSGGSRVSVTVPDESLPPALTWDLCYKMSSTSDELKVSLTGQPDQVVKASAAEQVGVLRHLVLESSGAKPTLRVVPMGGGAQLCGLVVETDPKTKPGVVLDQLGINGARLTTPLAWNEAAWVAELRRRSPALVIFEYGTNESGDFSIHAASFTDNLRRMMARVRAASPDSDCLVLAPTDRADTQDRSPVVRDALREAAKVSLCRFWDTYEVMGGKGSVLAWRSEEAPRARSDGVHLTASGYRELGEKLTHDLLSGYQP